MTVTEFIQTSVPFLSGLTPEQAASLAAAAEQLSFKKGQTVLFRGVTVEGLHVVATGKVSVHAKLDKNSKTLTQVAQLGAGDVFGETSIIEMGTAGASIKSDEDGTLVFVIPQEAFRLILAENAEFQARATSLIAARKKKTLECAAGPVRELVAA